MIYSDTRFVFLLHKKTPPYQVKNEAELLTNCCCVPSFLTVIQSVQWATNAKLKLGVIQSPAQWREELRHCLVLLRSCTVVCCSKGFIYQALKVLSIYQHKSQSTAGL